MNGRKKIHESCRQLWLEKKVSKFSAFLSGIEFRFVSLRGRYLFSVNPENVIDETKAAHTTTSESPKSLTTEWSYFKIPFISERLDYRVSSSYFFLFFPIF